MITQDATRTVLFRDHASCGNCILAKVNLVKWKSFSFDVTVLRYEVTDNTPIRGQEEGLLVFSDAELLDDDANEADAIRYAIDQLDELAARWMTVPQVNILPVDPDCKG